MDDVSGNVRPPSLSYGKHHVYGTGLLLLRNRPALNNFIRHKSLTGDNRQIYDVGWYDHTKRKLNASASSESPKLNKKRAAGQPERKIAVASN